MAKKSKVVPINPQMEPIAAAAKSLPPTMSRDDLDLFNQAINMAQAAQQEAQNAQVALNGINKLLAQRYGLASNDQIDRITGAFTRAS